MNSYELMLSLLAHDSYNRGYDPDLPDLSVGNSNVIGDTIGNFRVINTSTNAFLGTDQEAGFYAVAYEALEDGNGFSAKNPKAKPKVN